VLAANQSPAPEAGRSLDNQSALAGPTHSPRSAAPATSLRTRRP
jgi:hypothetical protein